MPPVQFGAAQLDGGLSADQVGFTFVQVRAAREADAEALARVHVDTWRAAYQGLMPQEYLDGLDPAERAARWRQALGSPGSPFTAVVLEDESGTVVGFATVGPGEDDDAADPTVGLVGAMYVLSTHWRLGGGRLLMAEAIRLLSSAGCREATLWVLESNQRARRFYEAAGWRADGGHKIDESYGFPMSLVRYRRRLDQPEG